MATGHDKSSGNQQTTEASTGIDGPARYLLQLMRARNVSLVGHRLPIRASLDKEATPTSERH